MVTRRNLALLVLVAAVAGAIVGTGAFTSVTATRTMEINVAGDASALLSIAPNSTSPNGDYARIGNDGLTFVDITQANPDLVGDGVNDNAVTQIDHVFVVTNQGTQPVMVDVTDTPDGVTVYRGEETSQTGAVELAPGESVSYGLYIDTRPGAYDGGSTDITISGEATS